MDGCGRVDTQHNILFFQTKRKYSIKAGNNYAHEKLERLNGELPITVTVTRNHAMHEQSGDTSVTVETC